MNMVLNQALKRVNEEYFLFEHLPRISISQGQEKLNRKMITFGTYHIKKNEIKIHPILLKSTTPDFVLDFVIYHEMLHYQDRKMLLMRGYKQRVHTKGFRARERQFVKYAEAQEILKKILHGHKEFPKKLCGKELEDALVYSLQKLDMILNKYDLIESSKGVKNGAKKRNEKSELDCHD